MRGVTSKYLARRAEAERSALAARLIVLIAPEPEEAEDVPPIRPVEEARRGLPWKKLGLALGAGIAVVWLIRKRRK